MINLKITGIHLVGGEKLEHISELRWYCKESDGLIGWCTRAQLVSWLNASPEHKAFAESQWRTAEVFVVKEHNPPYVRTKSDDDKADNLLQQDKNWQAQALGEPSLPSDDYKPFTWT